MNWQGFGRKRSWPNPGTVRTVAGPASTRKKGKSVVAFARGKCNKPVRMRRLFASVLMNIGASFTVLYRGTHDTKSKVLMCKPFVQVALTQWRHTRDQMKSIQLSYLYCCMLKNCQTVNLTILLYVCVKLGLSQ
jgi:hypothetical protein